MMRSPRIHMVSETLFRKAVEKLRPLLAKVQSHERVASDKRLFAQFQSKFTHSHIDKLNPQDIKDFTSFNKNEHWSNLHRLNGFLLNDMEKLRKTLKHLVDESVPIEARYDRIINGDLNVKFL